jgi:hypothetical protein
VHLIREFAALGNNRTGALRVNQLPVRGLRPLWEKLKEV